MPRLLASYGRHTTGAWLLCALLLGALQAVDSRFSMNPDGIAYLDMGDAYLRGDWATAVRSHWSPLYAWLVAAIVRLAQPPPGLEFPFVHAVNFGVYGLALAAFTFLLRQIRLSVADRENGAPGYVGLPVRAWTSLGYATFVWCTLRNIPLSLVTPDLLVSAFVYALCGLSLWTRRHPSWRGSALSGALLGFGYLAKAPMLPLAVVFLVSSTWLVTGRTRRLQHMGLAAGAMALIGVPFVVVLSVANGRPTAGDSAMLNYLWMIDGLPLVHWQGGPDGLGQPLHHSQLVLDRPAIFAFDSPFPVTYAPWYAPEFWFVGAVPVFSVTGQLHALAAAVQAYASQAVDLGVVFALLALLLSMHAGPWRIGIDASIALLAPAPAALGLYALVLVEGRYVAPFLVLLILGLLMLVQLPRAPWSVALAARVSALIVLVLAVQIAWTTANGAASTVMQVLRGRVLDPDDQTLIAGALRSAGIRPGDAVATGDRAFNAYWARLARVRVVAEVSDAEGAAILDADPDARTAAQRVLVAQAVRVVVARAWPAQVGDPDWQPIAGTEYFYYLVPIT